MTRPGMHQAGDYFTVKGPKAKSPMYTKRTPITCGACGTVYADSTPGEPHATRRMVEAGWLVVWLPRGASRRCPECHDGQM